MGQMAESRRSTYLDKELDGTRRLGLVDDEGALLPFLGLAVAVAVAITIVAATIAATERLSYLGWVYAAALAQPGGEDAPLGVTKVFFEESDYMGVYVGGRGWIGRLDGRGGGECQRATGALGLSRESELGADLINREDRSERRGALVVVERLDDF